MWYVREKQDHIILFRDIRRSMVFVFHLLSSESLHEPKFQYVFFLEVFLLFQADTEIQDQGSVNTGFQVHREEKRFVHL